MGLFARDGFDPDAWTYIQAVETADGQPLEVGVRRAIGRFVRGCKDDGIWNAIKASCILAGARTLSGALVPLVGPAPTNNNFVSGDYNRITGLKGNGSTKYLNSNRPNNADPQNNAHISLFVREMPPTQALAGVGFTDLWSYQLNSSDTRHRSSSGQSSPSYVEGFYGTSRDSSSTYQARRGSTTSSFNVSSSSPNSSSIFVFARNVSGSPNFPTSSRISFYSIGESLDLALLDARVSQLMSSISNALS